MVFPVTCMRVLIEMFCLWLKASFAMAQSCTLSFLNVHLISLHTKEYLRTIHLPTTQHKSTCNVYKLCQMQLLGYFILLSGPILGFYQALFFNMILLAATRSSTLWLLFLRNGLVALSTQQTNTRVLHVFYTCPRDVNLKF